VLHLATHGYFLPNPVLDWADLHTHDMDGNRFVLLSRAADPLLRSGLVLAGVNPWLAGLSTDPKVEDGLLTALDVCGMDLLGTQLVVLSACNTGLGDVRNGEGVEGLRRAFIEAGARTVLMTLWAVPDEETMQLMVGLYDRLIAGQNSGSALRDARLAIRELHPQPYFWGAFVLLGNPASVSWD
jgi:CHAT domain-containing protein